VVAIDGSKFKGVNSKLRNDTKASMKRRIGAEQKRTSRLTCTLWTPKIKMSQTRIQAK
jgi:hypothetical protein